MIAAGQALWLIPALPLAGFLILALGGTGLGRRAIATVGVGSVGLSALVATAVSLAYLQLPASSTAAFSQTIWGWMTVGDFEARLSWHFDALTLVMVLVITGIGFLIHLYSVEYMAGDEGYARFFAYMNLFVASMLVLVLAGDLLPLFLGWEGVGLCSYLLIGFWYRDPVNGAAAQKAFYMTRLGDTAFLLGLLYLWSHLGTLDIQGLLQRAVQQWPVGSTAAVVAAALLLGGAIGKSAQLPLQTWLPDAMAGPTPVSALLHAATMVTAGVYLIARLHPLYELAPVVQVTVGGIGALTLLLAAASACVQQDIKRVLAYSTISQIGYMFLALGVGAWSAALFHFLTHACFKALLFLAAGAVILSVHHEQNIFRMGGLASRLPLVLWTFLIGAGSLAGLPFITAGFFSKDWILAQAWLSPLGREWLWGAGVLGAVLTAFYSFRLVFRVFLGPPKTDVVRRPGRLMTVPLASLAALSIAIGWLQVPQTLGDVQLFSRFLAAVFRSEPAHLTPSLEWALQLLVFCAVLVGIALAYVLVLRRRDLTDGVAALTWRSRLAEIWQMGWGFDRLYQRVVVGPFLSLASAVHSDPADRVSIGIMRLSAELHATLSMAQNGQLRWYAGVLTAGSVAVMAIIVFW